MTPKRLVEKLIGIFVIVTIARDYSEALQRNSGSQRVLYGSSQDQAFMEAHKRPWNVCLIAGKNSGARQCSHACRGGEARRLIERLVQPAPPLLEVTADVPVA